MLGGCQLTAVSWLKEVLGYHTFCPKSLHKIRKMTSTNTQDPQKLPQHKRDRIYLLSAQITCRAEDDPLQHAEEVFLGDLEALVEDCVNCCLDCPVG